MMEAVVTTGSVRRTKLQSNNRHQQTHCFIDRYPSCRPTNNVRALKEKTFSLRFNGCFPGEPGLAGVY